MGYCIQGFRKIDSDRWEFANEGFIRGKRHLLKNIHRRKSSQSQLTGSNVGPSSEIAKPELESEVERLTKQKSFLMQEVIELQQQQRGTVHQMEVVKERIQAAETRQKKMLSFLAKMLQNPDFLASLARKKDQIDIGVPRMMRKFVRHQQLETGKAGSSMGGQIVKYRPGLENLSAASLSPPLDPDSYKLFPDDFLQGIVGKLDLGVETMTFETRNVSADELAAVTHELVESPEQVREGATSLGPVDLLSKGKSIMISQPEGSTKNDPCFIDDPAKERAFPEIFPSGIDGIIKQEDLWSMGFDYGEGMTSSCGELWGNAVNYDVPDLGFSSGMSDIWDLGSLQAAEGLGVERWPMDVSTSNEPKHVADQPKDTTPKN